MTVAGYSEIAVLVPCLNEEASIAKVVEDFRAALPGATIYVYDNASEDNTVEVASNAGATVRTAPARGKGNVIARMFREIEADYYLLVDGDATYDASVAPEMLNKARSEMLDVLIAVRRGTDENQYRAGHQFGNRLLTGMIALIFSARITDALSGYRLMSRRFVKSFPVSAHGFEIETEMTVHMLEIGVPFDELPTDYFQRLEDSRSKLNTWRDGFRILRTIGTLVAAERPIAVFSGLGLAAMAVAVLQFLPVLTEFRQTGAVPRFPTLIASTALGTIGLISFFGGLILNGVTSTRRDMKKLAYLGQAAPSFTGKDASEGK